MWKVIFSSTLQQTLYFIFIFIKIIFLLFYFNFFFSLSSFLFSSSFILSSFLKTHHYAKIGSFLKTHHHAEIGSFLKTHHQVKIGKPKPVSNCQPPCHHKINREHRRDMEKRIEGRAQRRKKMEESERNRAK